VAAVSAVLALGFATGPMAPVTVLAALLARGVGGALHGPAMLAATSRMVPAEHLARIQGLNQVVQGGMLIVSAPLGALLVAWLSMPWVLVVDVLTALVAIVPLAFVAVPGPERAPGDAPARSAWADLRDGLSFVASRAGHRSLLGLAAAINLCLVPAFALLPLLIHGPLGGQVGALGAAQSAFGVGTLVGGAVLGAWGGTRRRIETALGAIAGIGLVTAGLGVAPAGAAGAAAIGMGVLGALGALANGPIVAVLQATVPAAVQGRVFGLYGSLATLATPIGLVLAAPLAELAGIRVFYVAGGVACAALAVLGASSRAIRRIEDEAPTEPVQGVP
jgi:DHA3 family macrolide efflux protein-like MFS transporter